jgi:hypothetical protein
MEYVTPLGYGYTSVTNHIKPYLSAKMPHTKIIPDILDPCEVHIISTTCMVCGMPSGKDKYVSWRNPNLCGINTTHYFWTHCDNEYCFKRVTLCRDSFEDHVRTKFPMGFLDIFEKKCMIRVISKGIEYIDGQIEFDSYSWIYPIQTRLDAPNAIDICVTFDFNNTPKTKIFSFEDLMKWNS